MNFEDSFSYPQSRGVVSIPDRSVDLLACLLISRRMGGRVVSVRSSSGRLDGERTVDVAAEQRGDGTSISVLRSACLVLASLLLFCIEISLLFQQGLEHLEQFLTVIAN